MSATGKLRFQLHHSTSRAETKRLSTQKSTELAIAAACTAHFARASIGFKKLQACNQESPGTHNQLSEASGVSRSGSQLGLKKRMVAALSHRRKRCQPKKKGLAC